ncbi:MAG: heparinase II/III family protein [Anaerolineales bacterium]|jgi:hypothetical protein
MNTIERAMAAGRELGWGALLHYARYQLALHSGRLRQQTPIFEWRDRPSSSWVTHRSFAPEGHFFADAIQLSEIQHFNQPSTLEAAEDIAAGRFSLFGLPPVQLRFPPDWWAYPPLAEARGDERAPLDRHWASIDLGQVSPDVKLCWELSRFGWVFPLVRAYVSTGDERFVHTFLQLLRSWRQQNRPNNGIHWVSAQEVALRILALCLAAYAFQPALDQITGGHEIILQTVAVHAARIPPSLAYARAQNNNHLLSEAAGLLTAGLVYPQLKHADAWTKLGWRTFVQGIDRQVFTDGGYIQHSTNYHRLALQLGLWTSQLAEVNNFPLPDHTRAKLSSMTAALAALVDPASGHTPNFGPNDGALILPLSQCPFRDYRPTLQAASRLFHNQDIYPAGPWDEESRWYGLHPTQTSRHAGKHPTDLSIYGLHLMTSSEAWGILRAANFQSRPGHSDQLHFDLWRQGENLARDAGTYLYNGQPPWDNRLSSAAVHNSVIVDRQEPMRREGRFLWIDWDQARFLHRAGSTDGPLEAISAQRDDYGHMGITHRRTVIRAGHFLWVVLDDLLGEETHAMRLDWLLAGENYRLIKDSLDLSDPGHPWQVRLKGSPTDVGLYRAGQFIDGQRAVDDPVHLGWFAWTYAHKEPGLHLVAHFEGQLPIRAQTWFVLGQDDPEELALSWEGQVLKADWRGRRLSVDCSPMGDSR